MSENNDFHVWAELYTMKVNISKDPNIGRPVPNLVFEHKMTMEAHFL